MDFRSVQIEVNGNVEGYIEPRETLEVNTNIVPTSVTLINNVLDIQVPAAISRSTATLMQTGQTTVYRTGDDADNRLTSGRATDFLTLAENNPFGNTNRFTDELGGSTYTNNIVIDWSTYNGSTVFGFRKTFNGSYVTWTAAIDDSLAVSIGTFTTGWRLPNIREMINLIHYAVATGVFNYAPFSLTTDINVWSGTTNHLVTANARGIFSTSNGNIAHSAKTGASAQWFPARTFTVTGTTLS